MKKLISFITLGFLLTSCTPQVTLETQGELCTLMEAKRVEIGAPAMAVMTANSEGVTQLCASGFRSVGQPEQVTLDDLWHLGSNTKAMTASLIGAFVADGSATWDDTLGSIIGEDAGEFKDVTYRDLLSHQGGLVANLGMGSTMRIMGADADRNVQADRKFSAEKVLALPKGPRAFAYSNAGYTVAAYMLETQQGAPYETLIKSRLWDPLDMKTAGFGPPGVEGANDQPRGHRPLMALKTMKAYEPPLADNPPAMNSAGRAHMSLTDYSKFLIDQLRGMRGDERALLPTEIYTALHSPLLDNYALGWGVTEQGLSHSGSNTMWLVTAHINPEKDLIVVTAANDGRLEKVSEAFKAIATQAAETSSP